MPKYYINPEKKYVYPKEIAIKHFEGNILVIAPMTANWIVLKNESQLNTFYELGKKSISDVLNSGVYNIEDVREVVTQLEARRFCTKIVENTLNKYGSMHLYLTNNCNLRCPHCYMFSGKSDENELSLDELKSLCVNYKRIGGESVSFSGGEPLMRRDFPEIVKFASKIGLKVKIYSNGSLWSESLINNIYPYINIVQISIDGFSENSNSVIRGKGHFSVALKTVGRLIEKRIHTSIAITPPANILEKEIEKYVDFVEYLEKTFGGDFLEVKFSESIIKGRHVCPTKEDNKYYISLINELRKRIHGEQYEIIPFVKQLEDYIILDNCMFGDINVASNGDVYYCARISDLVPYANVRTTPFDIIAKMSSQASYATEITMLNPCKDCDIRFICGGGCRIDEFNGVAEVIDFKSVDENCFERNICTERHKEHFYDLMVKSNEYFYRVL